MATNLNAKWVKEHWEKGTERRGAVDHEAYRNVAFIYGEHYGIFDPMSKRFRRPPPDDGRVRLTINHIKAMWRGELARLLKSRPIPEVIAPSDQDTDRRSARAASRLLNSELERLNFEQFRTELLTWVTANGMAYAHPHWDPDAKNGEGEVALDLVLMQELVRDPIVRRDLREGMWCIHGRLWTPEIAEERYNQKFKPSGSTDALNLTRMIHGWQASGDAGEDMVLVLRLWHRPCKDYPKGRLVTVINEKTVEEMDFPYDHGELPFIDFHHIRLPGRYEGQSVIADLISPQKDYNAARSRLAEIRGYFSSPQILSPEGALDQERITARPGAIINFRPVGMYRPEPFNLGSPPQFLFQEAQTAYGEMQDIARQHEVTKGQIPSAGMPATAVAMLQEADDAALGPTIIGIERGVARIGKHILSLVQQYWDEPRAIRVWSEETNYITVESFMGSDINESFDVQVVPGSAQPRSQATQRQDLLALWDRGIVRDPRILVDYMEMPNSEGIKRTLDVDTRHAQREHDMIYKQFKAVEEDPEAAAALQPVVPESWHNHDVHLAEHNNYRKTEEFESWPVEARAAMDEHVKAHEQQRLEQAMKMAQEQMMLMPPQGAPPGPGGPGGGPPGGPPEEGGPPPAGAPAGPPGGGGTPPAGAPQNVIPGINAPEEGTL